jgi:hypothetical protein
MAYMSFYGTGCDNIRNVPRRLKNENQKELDLLIFEHLLFEGTENIKRGEWFKIVTGNGIGRPYLLLQYSHLIILN